MIYRYNGDRTSTSGKPEKSKKGQNLETALNKKGDE